MPICKINALTITVLFILISSSFTFAASVRTKYPVKLLEEPSFSAPAVLELMKDENIEVLGYDGAWIKVKTGQFTGYVANKWVDGAEPPKEESRHEPKEVASEFLVATSDVDMMRSPTFQSFSVTKIHKGDKLGVFAKVGDWYEVKNGEHRGYLEQRFVTDPVATEKKKKKEISEILLTLKKVPAEDSKTNMDLYARLANLDPSNSTYQTKFDKYKKTYESKIERENAKARAGSVLELVSWTWSKGSSYAITEGMVKNITNTKIDNIEAVAAFFTKNGDFITYKSSFIEYRPLMPGQSSPFKVYTSLNPMMEKASITFKTFRGEQLPSYSKK